MTAAGTRNRGLGRGLQSLIPLPANGTSTQMIPVDLVRPSGQQVRRRFAADALRDLTDSIRAHGVLQPILVRRAPDGFELIAGERRWRAARQAGLDKVPAIVREAASDNESLLLGLIENLQREDLDPIEEARGIERLIEQFGLTHEEAASRLGRHRVAVSQSLRLLQASPAVMSATAAGAISAGHARALVGLPDAAAQERGLRVVLAKQLSVRQAERWVRTYQPPAKPRGRAASARATSELAEALREALGTPVTITGATRGRLVIEFHSRTQLEAIAARLTG